MQHSSHVSASPSANTRCRGPLSRRSFLQAGTLAFGGLAMSDVWRMQAQAGVTPSTDDPAVIFIWLPGGPPHMEMYDMKPDAPLDYRGEFHPVPTNVPGLDVCELMPLHTQCADRYTIIRSIAHEFADHGGGHKRFLTGRKPATPTGFVNDAPAVGSIVSKCLEDKPSVLPRYISGTNPGRAGVDTYSFGAAWLGPSYVPFSVPGDPNEDDFEVKNLSLANEMSDRLDDRKTLLTSLDRLRRQVDKTGMMDAMDQFNQRAIDLLLSEQAREAFDLSREPDALRERYGRHAWGQRALLARRLVEAGCSFVTMVMEQPYQSGNVQPKSGVYNWDSHAVNCHLFEDGRFRLPIYDRAVTALVEDLHNRGLDKRVLLVVTGEFGRTPKITEQTGTASGVKQPGRDHWPNAMSMLVSGGGLKMGQVIGATNGKGEYPIERPLTPNDLWATVYRHLGINPDWTFPNHAGRPMPILPFGKVIEELV